MLENFLSAWRVPDLRRKLLFTAAMLLVYRLGSHLPAPAEEAAAAEPPAEETVDDAVAEATDTDVEAGETT